MIDNKLYDILKWISILFLPAFAVLIGTIGQAINFEYTEIAVIIINAIAVFLGTVIGISTNKYNKLN